MTGQYQRIAVQLHIVFYGNLCSPSLTDPDFTTMFIGAGAVSIVPIVQHQIIRNPLPVHSLNRKNLSIRQSSRSVIRQIFLYGRFPVFIYY